MEEGNVTVLVDAKEEYTKQLISILKPCIYQGIKSIYMDAKDICNQDNTPDNVLMVFQDLLSRIPKWSQDIINKEFERITNVSKCDYIDDLLKVVYVSHIKILTIVHSAQRNKKISLKVPSGSHFIHLCYIECAREFWKDPYYFSDRVTKYEHQKNMRDSESMIAECVMETIRKQLPVRHILKEFLNEPDEDIEEEDEDIKEHSKKKYLKKLESVVKKELKSTSKTGDIGDINIELIRKVIREEMDSRPSTDKIKKELVDTVIEKIVEKTQEEFVDSEDSSEKDKDAKENAKDNNNTVESIVKDSLVKVGDSVLDTAGIAVDTVDETVSDSGVSSKETKETKEPKKSVDFVLDKTEIIGKTKSKSNSLENLLNDDADNLDNDIDLEMEDVNLDIDSLVTNTIVDKKKEVMKEAVKEAMKETVKETVKEKSNLVINNIDEINLNLDELDDDLDIDNSNVLDNDLYNEIDLNEIQSVDFNKKSTETKNSSKDDTKYIFFKDL